MSNKFKEKLAELAGRAGAAYRQRLKEANDKAAAQARYNAAENFCATWCMIFAWLLWEAIRATAPLTGLVEPLAPTGLMTDKPVLTLKGGCKALVFSGWSKPGFNSIPVNQIQSQLNGELRRLCFLHGYPQIYVIKVHRHRNHSVGFIMALAADVRAAQQAIKAAQIEKNKNAPIQI